MRETRACLDNNNKKARAGRSVTCAQEMKQALRRTTGNSTLTGGGVGDKKRGGGGGGRYSDWKCESTLSDLSGGLIEGGW